VDDGTDRFALVHEVESRVDPSSGITWGDEVVDVDFSPYTSRRSSVRRCGRERREGGALPHAPGDELEGARLDLLPGAATPMSNDTPSRGGSTPAPGVITSDVAMHSKL